MKEIAIINGPNLNLLGVREPEVYGSRSMSDFFAELQKLFDGRAVLSYFQSNSEGEIIDEIHRRGFSAHGIVLNAGVIVVLEGNLWLSLLVSSSPHS